MADTALARRLAMLLEGVVMGAILAAAAAGLLVIVYVLGGFGKSIYETSGFESARTGISKGRTVNLFVEGRYREYDSAGIHVERRGPPYHAELSVAGGPASDVREIGLTLTPRRGGPPVVVDLYRMNLDLPGDSLFARAVGQGLSLAHEEHVAVVTVRTDTGAGVHTDTVRLRLVPTFTTRTVSIRDWFSRL